MCKHNHHMLNTIWLSRWFSYFNIAPFLVPLLIPQVYPMGLNCRWPILFVFPFILSNLILMHIPCGLYWICHVPWCNRRGLARLLVYLETPRVLVSHWVLSPIWYCNMSWYDPDTWSELPLEWYTHVSPFSSVYFRNTDRRLPCK